MESHRSTVASNVFVVVLLIVAVTWPIQELGCDLLDR